MNRPLLRMDTGMDVLEKWSAYATPRDKDAVYAALFAMADRSLFQTHEIVEDGLRLNEFFVLLQGDIVLRMRMNCYDSFGLVYLGPRAGAPAR